jgi:hypothetical protein
MQSNFQNNFDPSPQDFWPGSCVDVIGLSKYQPIVETEEKHENVKKQQVS